MSRPLSDRIAALFRTYTGGRSSHGSQAWFARLLRVTPRAVNHWQSGENPMDGPALSLLTRLETVAQMIREEEAAAVRWGSETIGAEWEAAKCRERATALRSLLTPE